MTTKGHTVAVYSLQFKMVGKVAWKAEAEGSGMQDLQLQSKFEASLGYTRPASELTKN